MATPMSMFRASERFITATGALNPAKGESRADSETNRLCANIGGLKVDQESATELLEALASDASPFNGDQRNRIANVLQSIMDGEQDIATMDHRACAEAQQCLTIYKYWPEQLWAIAKSNDTLKNKFRHVAQFCVTVLRLRNPSPQTLRTIVATLHVASEMLDRDPSDAYTDVRECIDIFKQKRDSLKGEQSFKVFPDSPEEFMLRYPGAYEECAPPIECPFPVQTILDRATKDAIPLKNTNKKIIKKGATSQLQLVTRDMTPPNMQMQCNQMMMQMCREVMSSFVNGAPNAPGSASDIPGLKYMNSGHSSRSAVGEHDTPDRSAQKKAGCLSALQDDIKKKMQNSAKRKAEEADAESDTDSEEIAEPPKKTSKKIAESVDEDSEESAKPTKKRKAATGKNEADIIVKRGKPAAAIAHVKGADASTSTKLTKVAKVSKKPSLVEVVMSGQSIFKFPDFVKKLQATKALAGRPKPTKEPTEYHGGKIYWHKSQEPLKLYKRSCDTMEQKIPVNWSDKKHRMSQWALACAMIESDSREFERIV